MKSNRILILSVLAVAAWAFAGPAATGQRVLHVPTQYQTVQSAIQASTSGDIVLVAPGTYSENIDFLGKAITVLGASGPSETVLDGGGRNAPVVTFKSKEGRNSLLSGFAVTRSKGGGILVADASPTITNTHIDRNSNSKQDGGGVRCTRGQPAFIDCRITSNGTAFYGGLGGGIYGGGTPLVINTIIANNAATDGGGIQGSAHVINSVIFGNFAEEVGGGIDGSATVVNSILWHNNAKYNSSAYGAMIQYSCVQGGYYGTGNISQDPKFADYSKLDFHLLASSPCIGKGLNTVTNLPQLDFEGDARVAPVNGTVDMGADEFAAHLYYVGKATSNSTIEVKLIGGKGAIVLWAHSTAVLPHPITFPGIQGGLLVDPNAMKVFPLGTLPASGLIKFPLVFPPSSPPVTIPMQALIGTQLTNLELIKVR